MKHKECTEETTSLKSVLRLKKKKEGNDTKVVKSIKTLHSNNQTHPHHPLTFSVCTTV